ncbi:MAG TPA: nucleotidyl transferase AbiEii/AbiGii toxin family protein [Bacteroidales bacterium]|nr:nucleotidyl transferase AbiEii/AbiGii toxin family protein [Bacteroidales bacterium]
MIPQRYINEWRQSVAWLENYHVEQDLVISRALVEIFSDEYLKEHLAFRGGTALHKLYANPAARYSEDIDLVQIKPEPIGEALTRLRKVLSFIEGPMPTLDRGDVMTTLRFRFASEDNPPLNLKLKVEINCREHLAVYGLNKQDFSIKNEWYKGASQVITFQPEELLATKLRALYQRKKGRDLFDLWYSLTKMQLTPDKIVSAFHKYMEMSQRVIRRNEYLANMDEKMNDTDFRKDIIGLLHPSITYDMDEGYALVKDSLLMLLNE